LIAPDFIQQLLIVELFFAAPPFRTAPSARAAIDGIAGGALANEPNSPFSQAFQCIIRVENP
jgi:hypothetical protein